MSWTNKIKLFFNRFVGHGKCIPKYRKTKFKRLKWNRPNEGRRTCFANSTCSVRINYYWLWALDYSLNLFSFDWKISNRRGDNATTIESVIQYKQYKYNLYIKIKNKKLIFLHKNSNLRITYYSVWIPLFSTVDRRLMVITFFIFKYLHKK